MDLLRTVSSRWIAVSTLALLLFPLVPLSVSAQEHGLLIVRTEPAGATVLVNDDPQREATPNRYRVPAGEPLRIRVEMEGYESWEDVIEALSPGERRVLDISDEPLRPLRAGLTLRTEPDVFVYLQTDRRTERVGETGLRGVLEIDGPTLTGVFGAGAERVRVLLRKEGFEDAVREVPWREGEAAEYTVEMRARPAILTVRSDPPGAIVRRGEERLGVTPADIPVTTFGEEFRLRLTAPGHEEAEINVSALDPGEQRRLEPERLTPLPGEVRLLLRDEEGRSLPPRIVQELEVYVDGERFELAGSMLRGLGFGEFLVVVEHEDYLPESFSVRVREGEVPEQRVELAMRPAILRLDFDVRADYNVRVNGERRSMIDNTLEVDPEKPLRLEVSAPGQLPFALDIDALRPNEEKTVRVRFETDQAPPPPPPMREPFTTPQGIEMIWVEPGSFTARRGGREIELAITRGFWMSAHEVTQSQYRQVANANPSARSTGEREVERRGEGRYEWTTVPGSRPPQRRRVWVEGEMETVIEQVRLENHPVERVPWSAAMDFCTVLNRGLGMGDVPAPAGYVFRLPTEAEWEYVARAGRGARGNWASGAVHDADGHRPVGSRRANPWGFYDLFGNVEEWCYDSWSDEVPDRTVNPLVLRDGEARVVRGGSFRDSSRALDPGRRSFSDMARDTIGFRIVLAPDVEHLPFLGRASAAVGRPGAAEGRDAAVVPPLRNETAEGTPDTGGAAAEDRPATGSADAAAASGRRARADPSGAAAAVSYASPSQLDGGRLVPQILQQPQVPPDELSRYLGRTVRLRLLVAPDGSVEHAEVVSSEAPGFDRYALEAVKAWRFAPPRLNDEPVHVAFIQPLTVSRP